MFTKSAIILAAANLAAAHTTFQSFVIGGKNMGQHFAVQTPSNGNNPIYDVSSTAMICNGGKATSDEVEVAAGSKVGMQWHHNDPSSAGDGDDPIAPSHKGPVMVYIAKADSKGQGAVWTKIYEDGLTGGKWGVENFIANKGLIEVSLPNLEPGSYLIRPEVIGLHEAAAEKKAQFYNGCGQIKVTGSGSVALPATGVDMTKAYSATDPGVKFDIYSGKTSYTIPGPKVWTAGSSSGGSAPASPVATPAASPSVSPSASPVAAPSNGGSSPSNGGSAPSNGGSAPSNGGSAPSNGGSAPSPSTGSGSGSSLPESFTIDQFISWLKTATGSTKTRRHARSFNL
ncbi:Glyco hydro 61 domain containing protein [Pyrenophora teres f. maculata]|nr:Glyco hydro 61 domain containing protein [Pyrenophora teres f. maculata]